MMDGRVKPSISTIKKYPFGSTKKKVGVLEKLSYANLDFSGQLIATVVNSYLMYFFTDVAAVSAAATGIILLLARVVDAVGAPVWGTLMDMTHSKYGKARPYFLWLAFPYAASAVLLFWAPNLTPTAKAIYCGVVYMIYGVLYLGINAPITTMLTLITSSPTQRVKLNSWRMVGSQLGVFIVNSLTLPLVALFGDGNDVIGFRIFIIIFATLNFLGTLFSFSHIRERVIVPNSQRVTLRKSIHAMNKNWPWFLIVGGNFLFWIAQQGRQQSMVYYFTYYFHNKGLVTFFNSIAIIQVIGIISIPLLNKFLSKSHIWALGLVGAVLGQFIIMFAHLNIIGAVVGWLIANIGSGIACSMPFAMLGSAVDYGEWKNGVNAAGILTTVGSAFCMSMGMGLAGALNGGIMSAFGYVANHVQTAHALVGISISFNWVTILMYGLAIIPAILYQRFENMEPTIIAALDKTRK
ncbi:MFS transporter [Limosilactobacillus sp. STM2_1]|uniref:MFS transporter n=2 Tax=Limosilactobacillus rudii TaxID=2759755 RepID=A0A7W3YN00_9LACO|nr:glycoside-pentoside-hexuronide (GPH):cation symporter [Limosilactobacillus rudii]MBB1079915.1 MFS transporter [Limosilactobacillus rudii]MBB1097994.1 MFS transporter [Limosilactobacillus rudii]MCD7135063.1 glycoside-pentoside-hexuronide (GPH):cation symporter [Limosilactobacillus rudii]